MAIINKLFETAFGLADDRILPEKHMHHEGNQGISKFIQINNKYNLKRLIKINILISTNLYTDCDYFLLTFFFQRRITAASFNAMIFATISRMQSACFGR